MVFSCRYTLQKWSSRNYPWLNPSSRLNTQADPTKRLCSVYYTSGSTGKPKAVVSAHAGYIYELLARADYVDFLPGLDAEAGCSSLTWDSSIQETMGAWAAGCLAIRLTSDQIKSGPGLVALLQREKATQLDCVPSLLPTLTSNPQEDLPLLRIVTLGGEAVPQAVVDLWARGGYRRIISNYGPTEASIEFCQTTLLEGEEITLGTPFMHGEVGFCGQMFAEQAEHCVCPQQYLLQSVISTLT